jgi:excisionase family DNA binding protein
MKVRQAAELLGVSTKTVRRWIKAGELPHWKVGGQYRISEDDLNAVVERRGGRVEERGGDDA